MIGKQLAQRLALPFISKDSIKELIFDGLGWQDREWSKKVGLASYDLFYYFAEVLLKAGGSFILESNFKPQFDNPKIQALKEKYSFQVTQIICKAEGRVLFERFKARAESGNRHPGHVDTLNYKEFENSLLTDDAEPLSIEGKIIEVDTNDFGKINIDQIVNQIKEIWLLTALS